MEKAAGNPESSSSASGWRSRPYESRDTVQSTWSDASWVGSGWTSNWNQAGWRDDGWANSSSNDAEMTDRPGDNANPRSSSAEQPDPYDVMRSSHRGHTGPAA